MFSEFKIISTAFLWLTSTKTQLYRSVLKAIGRVLLVTAVKRFSWLILKYCAKFRERHFLGRLSGFSLALQYYITQILRKWKKKVDRSAMIMFTYYHLQSKCRKKQYGISSQQMAFCYPVPEVFTRAPRGLGKDPGMDHGTQSSLLLGPMVQSPIKPILD